MNIFVVLFVLSIVFSSCTRYQGTSTRILHDLGVNYEVAKEIPHYPNADAVYDSEEDKIYVKKGKQQVYLILHELMHKIRSDAGHEMGGGDENHRFEEIIAVRAAVKLGRKAKLQLKVGKWEIPGLINKTLRANGIEPRRLTEKETEYIDKEIEKTVQLFVELLKERGHSFDEVDWVRTAILILL